VDKKQESMGGRMSSNDIRNPYRLINECLSCAHRQKDENNGICENCGYHRLEKIVAQWIDTSKWNAVFTLKYTGQWKKK
jgi:rRNA maturation endonuclease Nob1